MFYMHTSALIVQSHDDRGRTDSALIVKEMVVTAGCVLIINKPFKVAPFLAGFPGTIPQFFSNHCLCTVMKCMSVNPMQIQIIVR